MRFGRTGGEAASEERQRRKKPYVHGVQYRQGRGESAPQPESEGPPLGGEDGEGAARREAFSEDPV